MARRKKVYEGKAKILYEGPEPGTLIQYFKDDSAPTVAAPATLEGKGVLNNRLSEFFMTGLNQIGVPTHFIRRLNMREQLIREGYRGIRPAPGYPAQPDHTEKPILFDLLGATEASAVTLTESCAMHPGAAVCGLYFSHPESHYFAISALQRDQIEDYASRKGMTVALITHETDIAEYASRVIVLRDGLIVEDRPISRRRDAAEELRRLPAATAVRLPGLEAGEEEHA